MKPRRASAWGGILLGFSFLASAALAQSPSPSTSPTSDPAGPALIIGCDRTAIKKSFCTTDSDVCCNATGTDGCVAANSCPLDSRNQRGQCIEQSIFIENECTINSFFDQFILLAQWGVSFVGLLGLLMMVYGGVQWITAGGRSSKIEEGKRVVLGTLVGITISFTAYIIVNFTVAAITGTTARSFNPFSGPIATVFGNRTIDGQSIEQPFSGDGQGVVEDRTNCRATWDFSCDNEIFCVDPGAGAGRVTEFQKQLNSKNCFCGTADGCFGANTATCVRRFQIANSMEPTGIIDGTTSAALESPASQDCVSSPVADQINGVINNLPKPSIAGLSGISRVQGCCVVLRASEATAPPLFCSDNMTERTCASLGSENIFIAGKKCAFDNAVNDLCGFCHNGGNCLTQTGRYWCESVLTTARPWEAGAAAGHISCSMTPLNTLRTTF